MTETIGSIKPSRPATVRSTMSRRARFAGIACAAFLAQAGCYGDLVSTHSEAGGDTGGEDPGGGDLGGGDPGGGADPGPDPVPIPDDVELTCAEPTTTTDDGHHQPGSSCGGCHDGSIGPAFTVAGTLYADPAGGQAVTGATVTIIDADQNRIDMVAALNGNFWTNQPVTFPVTTFASSCPDVIPMTTVSDSGDCNSCHGPGNAISFAP